MSKALDINLNLDYNYNYNDYHFFIIYTFLIIVICILIIIIIVKCKNFYKTVKVDSIPNSVEDELNNEIPSAALKAAEKVRNKNNTK